MINAGKKCYSNLCFMGIVKEQIEITNVNYIYILKKKNTSLYVSLFSKNKKKYSEVLVQLAKC